MVLRFASVSLLLAAGTVIASSACSGSTSPTITNAGTSSGGSSGGASADDGGTAASSSSGGGGASGSSGASVSSSGSGPGQSPNEGGASSGASGSSSSSSSGGSSSGATGSYPSGPYCQAAGSGGHLDAGCVLPDTTWIGYSDPTGTVLASTAPYASYSLDDARATGRRYAMINLAEFDCPGCQNSATELEARAASVEQAGGLVIEVLETSGFVTQASMTDLDYWVTNYMLKNTTVKDPDGSGTPSLDFFGRRDQAYIVDLTTMTILQYIDGSIVNATPAENSAGLAMDAMLKLLGD